MMKSKRKIIILNLIFCAFIVYAVITFISQEITLTNYSSDYSYYQGKTIEENNRNAVLLKEKENINTDQYIEKIAREKLGLVMPNETIYIDSSRY